MAPFSYNYYTSDLFFQIFNDLQANYHSNINNLFQFNLELYPKDLLYVEARKFHTVFLPVWHILEIGLITSLKYKCCIQIFRTRWEFTKILMQILNIFLNFGS